MAEQLLPIQPLPEQQPDPMALLNAGEERRRQESDAFMAQMDANLATTRAELQADPDPSAPFSAEVEAAGKAAYEARQQHDARVAARSGHLAQHKPTHRRQMWQIAADADAAGDAAAAQVAAEQNAAAANEAAAAAAHEEKIQDEIVTMRAEQAARDARQAHMDNADFSYVEGEGAPDMLGILEGADRAARDAHNQVIAESAARSALRKSIQNGDWAPLNRMWNAALASGDWTAVERVSEGMTGDQIEAFEAYRKRTEIDSPFVLPSAPSAPATPVLVPIRVSDPDARGRAAVPVAGSIDEADTVVAPVPATASASATYGDRGSSEDLPRRVARAASTSGTGYEVGPQTATDVRPEPQAAAADDERLGPIPPAPIEIGGPSDDEYWKAYQEAHDLFDQYSLEELEAMSPDAIGERGSARHRAYQHILDDRYFDRGDDEFIAAPVSGAPAGGDSPEDRRRTAEQDAYSAAYQRALLIYGGLTFEQLDAIPEERRDKLSPAAREAFDRAYIARQRERAAAAPAAPTNGRGRGPGDRPSPGSGRRRPTRPAPATPSRAATGRTTDERNGRDWLLGKAGRAAALAALAGTGALHPSEAPGTQPGVVARPPAYVAAPPTGFDRGDTLLDIGVRPLGPDPDRIARAYRDLEGRDRDDEI